MKWVTALLLVSACCTGATPAGAQTPTAEEFFEKKVRPLLVEHCYQCHSATAKKLKGSLRLDSRAGLLQGGDSGPVVVAGQPEKSLLIQAVRYQNEQLHMPPPGKLPERDIATLEEWVRRGAPFPGTDPAAGSKQGINLAEGRKFWSFQPPR